jgi:hypothetical protein
MTMNWKKLSLTNRHAFKKFRNVPIPAIQLADDPSRPLDHGVMQYGDLDFEILINMRRQHQTKQAATGVRTKKFKVTRQRCVAEEYANFTK